MDLLTIENLMKITPFIEITADEWFHGLCCLPPLRWHHYKGLEIFFCAEMHYGSITNCYVQFEKKFFVAAKNLFISDEEIEREIVSAG